MVTSAVNTPSILLSALILATVDLRAQIVADGATATLANVTNTITGSVTVGTNGAFTSLVLSDNALLTNSLNGVIGRNSTAKSNEVRLVSATARWRMGGTLFVGSNGIASRLLVSNGARLESGSLTVGNHSAGSNNEAIVTGPGSTLNAPGLMFVGADGNANRLTILNGGKVFVTNSGSSAFVGFNPGGNNSALVADPGSRWSVNNTLVVGAGANASRLIVSNGATVDSLHGTIGSALSASNNLVMVTGAGSTWANGGILRVGDIGPRGQLIVSNGGSVLVGGSAYIGFSSFSISNRVTVDGAGSLWQNPGELRVGGSGSGNRLDISNGGGVASGFSYVGLSSSNNVVSVTGAGSSWSSATNLIVGFNGSANRLQVDNGALVTTSNAVLGFNAGANANSALIRGAGSKWLVTDSLLVGSNGANASLVISNGGFVSSGFSFLGDDLGSSNNVAVITGAGSAWSNALVIIGTLGPGNRLVVSNGGTVLSSLNCSLSGSPESSNNLALVTGSGSLWNGSRNLYVGDTGSANNLVVSNGAQAFTASGIVGYLGSGNQATVTSPGSLWSNRLDLIVGEGGSANRLVVTNGGTVSASNIVVGQIVSSTNNRVIVAGGTLRAANAAGTGILDVRRGTNVLNAGLVDVDQFLLTNRGTIVIPRTFGNASSNFIPFFGPASPYPSTITVAGLAGRVTKVSVTLSNLWSEIPDQLDVLLVSPAGQKVMLMSDAGGGFGIDRTSPVRLTFDDTAATLLPDSTLIGSGTYQPTDYEPGETLPGPAPAGPYATTLSSFNGSDPNGVWSLYIADDRNDASGGVGLLGWGLRFETDGLFVDPGGFEFNGGTLITRGALVNNDQPFVVNSQGGTAAVWEIRAGFGDHSVTRDLIVGGTLSSNNLLHVNGGTLSVPTPGTALDVRGGTNRLDSGLEDLTRLVVTNSLGQFEMFGGTLRTPSTTVANGRVFTVGGGASLATFQMLGGMHTFANNLTVANNGSLIGNGLVNGTVTVSPGGRLTPGTPIGRINVDGSVILQGTVNLQIDKSGGVRTNDVVSASGAIFYSGTLNVTDIGTDFLSAGDRFVLFAATPYVGAFATLNLPPLEPGLSWRNNLAVDGSIEVIAAGQPGFASIRLSGTNVILAGTNGTPNATYTVLASTNVALPLSNWVSIATNRFDASARFSFTNRIVPGFPQRFFQLLIP